MPTFQPLGQIELIKGVNIDVSYTHQYYFDTIEDQEAFFSSKIRHILDNGTYQRKNINTIQVPFQADAISDFNYMRWQNPQYSEKWYYAFITSIDYINPGTSRINYVLDVYQTYLFDVQWRQSFIEREHTRRWTRDTKGNTIPVVNTEPEGLEYGSEYETIDEVEFEQIPDTGWIVFGSTKVPQNAPLTVANMPSGIYYTFVPISTNQKITYNYYFQTNSTGGTVVPLASARQILTQFANDTGLVNSLCSAVYYPFLPIRNVSYTISGSDITVSLGTTVSYINLSSDPQRTFNALLFYTYTSSAYDPITPVIFSDTNYIYDNFPNYSESKLLMFPYSFMELTTKRGDSMVVKMEYLTGRIRGEKLTIGAFGTISSVNKMVYALKDYLTDYEEYNMMNGLSDLSSSNLPIIDSYTASYMQANANSLRVADSNAKANLQTNLDNAYRSFETAMSKRSAEGIKDVANIGENILAGALMTGVGTAVGSVGMAVGGIGSIGTGIASIPGALADYDVSKMQANNEYWNRFYSATTDYSNAISSIMAKKNDAKQIPPSSKNLGGDYIFNIANNCDKLYLRRKTIYPEYAEKLSNYFMQYGYKVNKLEVPNFHTRSSWNYIKMTEPNVYGDIPMNDLMKLRDIFIKGITLWHGDYIGDYSRNNDEI